MNEEEMAPISVTMQEVKTHDIIFDKSKMKYYIVLEEGILNTFPFYEKYPIFLRSLVNLGHEENSLDIILRDDYIADIRYCYNYGNIDSDNCIEYIKETDRLNAEYGAHKSLHQYQVIRTLIDFSQESKVYKYNLERAIQFFNI